MSEIKKVGVVGCGLMGSGIVQVAAAAGYNTVVREVNEERLAEGMAAIDRFLSKGVERGKLSADEREQILGRIEPTTRLSEFADADIIIEAVVEDVEAKKKVFAELDTVLSDEAIRCSNTSSLCVTEMAAATKHPNRFVGLHFFSPVPLMDVVEVIPTVMTSAEITKTVTEFSRNSEKHRFLLPIAPASS